VELVLGIGAGGGTDFNSRLNAAYWPAVVENGAMRVRNIEGAAGVVATNYVAEAEPDGLTLGMQSNGGSIPQFAIWGQEGVKWDKDTFTYIGSRITDQYFLAPGINSDIETIDDLKAKKDLTVSQFSIESGSDRCAVIVFEALGLTDAKMVRGYANLLEAAMGAGRGEVDCTASDPNNMEEALANGWIKEPILCMSDRRSPAFPDAPAVTEIAEIPDQFKGAWSITQDWTGRYIVYTRADIPEDRLQFLREKYLEINSHEGFLRQAKLKWSQLDDPLSGEEITEVMQRAWSVTKADAELLEDLQRQRGG
jgi:tripartite-type tricarboxylate transporter receptor subunit TctC